MVSKYIASQTVAINFIEMKSVLVMKRSIGTPILLLILAFPVLFSCGRDNAISDYLREFTNDSTTVIEVRFDEKPISFQDIIDSCSLVPLETTSDCVIGSIEKIVEDEGRVYVLDREVSKSLFMFDSKGKFLGTIGRMGRGPGEYAEPTDFVIVDSTLIIYDTFGRKFNYYNKRDGHYLNSVIIKHRLAEICYDPIENNIYAKTGDNTNNKNLKYYEVFKIDMEGCVHTKFIRNVNELNYLYNSAFTVLSTGGVLYRKSLRSGVFQINGDRVYTKYLFLFKNPLPKRYEEECKGDYEQFILQGYNKKYSYYYGNIAETNSYVIFNAIHNGRIYYVKYDKKAQEAVAGLPDTEGLIQGDVVTMASLMMLSERTYFQRNTAIIPISPDFLELDKKDDINQSNPIILIVSLK